MKKLFICSLFFALAFSNNSFSQDLKLMWPVKLKNPESKNLGFETPVPTIASTFAFVILHKPMKDKQPPVSTKASTSVSSVKNVKEKSVVSSKEEVVVLQPVVIEEKKEEVVLNMPEAEESETDKNINEARELLRVAERLANSIEDEKKELERDDVQIIGNVDSIKAEPVNVVLKFSKNQEEVSQSDLKKIDDALVGKSKNSELYFKIISYYDNPENRNIAFSRLLNARNVLLNKGIQTSQTMIMVLEDDTKTKANSVEIMF